MIDHRTLMQAASQHEEEIGICLKAWACEKVSDRSVLMSYWYADRRYFAKAVYIDSSGQVELEMVATHLNQKLGAGEATIKGMQAGFMSRLKKAGQTLEMVIDQHELSRH